MKSGQDLLVGFRAYGKPHLIVTNEKSLIVEARRSVEMSDTHRVEIRHQLFRIPEAKVEVELNADK
jgi:hypothetical protein